MYYCKKYWFKNLNTLLMSLWPMFCPNIPLIVFICKITFYCNIINLFLDYSLYIRTSFCLIYMFTLQHIVCCAGQQDETLCKNYISEVKDLRLRIDDCEAETVARIRKPVVMEPLRECVQKTTEQQVKYSQCSSCDGQQSQSCSRPFSWLSYVFHVTLFYLVHMLSFSHTESPGGARRPQKRP